MKPLTQKFYLLGLLLLVLGSCSKSSKNQSPDIKPVYTRLEETKPRKASQNFETVGELKANKEILVAAERPGQVEKIFVSEGLNVGRGQNLAQIKGDDVLADLDLARADYDSYLKLYNEGVISKQELLQYDTKLKKVKSQIDNLAIKAISGGTIGEIYVDPGDYVKAGDPIMDLVQSYPLRVSYSVPEKIISKVKTGQQVALMIESLPDREFRARVDFISPRIDPQTRTVLIRALLLDTDPSLKANQFVKIKQIISDLPEALMIREEAIYLDQGQEFIFVAVPLDQKAQEQIAADMKAKSQGRPFDTPTHTAERRAVKTGLRADGRVEILEGLKIGESYVYAGLHAIYPGAKIVNSQM